MSGRTQTEGDESSCGGGESVVVAVTPGENDMSGRTQTEGDESSCGGGESVVVAVSTPGSPEGNVAMPNVTEQLGSESVTTEQVIVTVPKERFVPLKSFKFPTNAKRRSCQRSWFDTFQWLHYDVAKDRVLCFSCLRARALGRNKGGRGYEDAFAVTGFNLWAKAMDKFRTHEARDQHVDASDFVLRCQEGGTNVIELIGGNLKTDQKNAQDAMRAVVSSLRYLARTGQAIRGHGEKEGKLYHLLEERSMDVPVLAEWIKWKYSWLSHDIQNEIIKMLAHKVERKILKLLWASPCFAIMADGTTDGAGLEQVCLVARYVNVDDLDIHEAFLEMFNPPDGTAQTIFSSLKAVLLALQLPIERLRDHCFDGAATMAGRLSGVQKRIKDEQPKSLFVHCANHSLDLALQEAAKNCELIADSLDLVRHVSYIILDSAKRRETYKNIVLTPCNEDGLSAETVSNLIPLCPTRWTVRTSALKRFVENYLRVRQTLTNIYNDSASSLSAETRSKIRGFQRKMFKFRTLFAIRVSICLFEPCEELARSLQSPKYTGAGAKHSASSLLETLQNLRESKFDELWDTTVQDIDAMNLEMAPPPRLTPEKIRANGQANSSRFFGCKGDFAKRLLLRSRSCSSRASETLPTRKYGATC